MLTLNTDFYNYQLASIHQQADLASDLCDFVRVINQISKYDFTDVSNEDFPEEGAFSLSAVLKGFLKGLWACFKWCLNIVGKVLNFLIHGYQPGFKRATSLIKQISTKLPTLQSHYYNYIVTLKSLEIGQKVIEKHVNTEVPTVGGAVPSGRIDKIRSMYIAEFNKLQSAQGQIDNNFALKKAPGTSEGKLRDFGIHGKQDLIDIVDKFEEIRKVLSEKLNDLKKNKCYKIRQVMNKLQDKNFAVKFVKNKVAVTETLIAVFESAIVGQDTKWLKSMQAKFLKELHWYSKKAQTVVAAEATDEDTPETEYHKTF